MFLSTFFCNIFRNSNFNEVEKKSQITKVVAPAVLSLPGIKSNNDQNSKGGHGLHRFF